MYAFGLSLLVVIMLIIIGILGIRFAAPHRSTTSIPHAPIAASKDDLLMVDFPLPGDAVSSPLTVFGSARGAWYFEASFPVKIYDSNGKLLGSVAAQAQGDWMTAEYVPFTARLTFATPSTSTGVLVLQKDNPSGLPEYANELRIPIQFLAGTR